MPHAVASTIMPA